MYYVIKKQVGVPFQTYIGFKVAKFIASNKNDTVIFEFNVDDKVSRKWVKKEDIILLTEDKNFFMQTMDKFKDVQEAQKKLVDEAKAILDQSIEKFNETMNAEIEEFNELKSSEDIPDILKEL